MRSLLNIAVLAACLLGGVHRVSAAAPPARIDPARVARLLHRLDAENFHVRQKADTTLRSLGRKVLPLLREELARTRSLEVRFRLRRMVEDLTFDERIPDLVKLLGHGDPQCGERAEYALRQAGASVVPLLRKELTPSLDAEQRKRLQKIIDDLSSQQR
jgi:DNA-binding MarR family transcriptional regulator